MKIDEDYFNNKYRRVSCLLCYFLEDTYLEPADRNDLTVIKTYIKEAQEGVIEDTIRELEAILALKPFPAKWIEVTANRFPFNDEEQYNFDGYYNWTQWMLLVLEIEARKVGKLK